MADYVVIDTAAGLAAACRSALAAGNGPVAVDVERASGFRYSQRAYLIQVFRRGAGIFLFNPSPSPPAGGDWGRLAEIRTEFPFQHEPAELAVFLLNRGDQLGHTDRPSFPAAR